MPRSEPRILIVDDETDTGANLSDILSDFGYTVDVARDGATALELLDHRSYDVALLDLKMPGMTGIELYRHIRSRHPSTVALIITAYASPETASEALAAGAWQVLSKPVDMSSLLGTIDRALEQPVILVVDDDEEFCASLWDVLREQGYRVALAHDVADARRYVADDGFDVALIDLKLPDADGVQAVQLIRESAPDAESLLVTAYRDELAERVYSALVAGARAVYYKPFDPQLLVRHLHELTAR